MATLAVFLDRLGRVEPAAAIAGFAFNPLAASDPQLTTAIIHLREVLGDQTYVTSSPAAEKEVGQLTTSQRSIIRRGIRDTRAAQPAGPTLREVRDAYQRKYGLSREGLQHLIDGELKRSQPRCGAAVGWNHRHGHAAPVTLNPEELNFLTPIRTTACRRLGPGGIGRRRRPPTPAMRPANLVALFGPRRRNL
jgi:hypothetical protein